MEAPEPNQKMSDYVGGNPPPDRPELSPDSWSDAPRIKPPSSIPRPSPAPMAGQPPEAFGQGVRENAPEAFGCPESRKQEEDREQEKNDEDEKENKKEKPEEKKKTSDKEKQSRDKKKGDEKKEPEKPPFYKRPVPMIILGIVLVLAIVGGVIWWLYARQFESTDDAFINGHIIPISPNVSATVAVVHIDDNYQVKKGELLVELDPRDYQAVVDQADANLAAAHDKADQARMQLDAARAGVTDAEAQIVIAKTNAENALLNYNRFAQLSPRARSQEQLDNATAAHKSADAQVQQAEAKLASAQANLANAAAAVVTADAGIKLAEANLDAAKINLGYCKIYAPEDGRITRKDVEPGSYVEKGQPLFSIVPTNVWVVANFKETQLKLMKVGQPVTIKIDAYGGQEFHGHVDSIQNGTGSRFSLLPAENATGNWVKVVQRVPVKIVFENDEEQKTQYLLAPGLSVEPKVRVR